MFGALTPQKRLPLIMSVFAGLFARRPDARLLLVGAPDARGDIERLARTLGITQAVISIESPDDAAFERAMQAVDVSVNLRWPSAGEMSGPWLQALAAGKPTIVTDLAHQTDIPALDPRTWQPLDPLDRLDGGSGREPVTVAIDLADEEHSLRLAMHRLADDAALRDRLGRAAHAYWAHEHSLERMTADYTRVLEIARTAPEPATVLPAAMSPDPMARARSVLSPFGLPLDALWTGKS